MPTAPNGGGQVARTRAKKRQKRRTSASFKARKRLSDAHEPAEAASPSEEHQVVADEHVPERCAVHPGLRNEQWCDDCQTAICTHCASSHHPKHAVTTLSAAYDDAYEAIEAMQHTLVGYLGDTRARKSQLDTQSSELSLSFVRAQEALDTQVRASAGQVEARYEQLCAQVQGQIESCAEWRAALEDTLQTVQQMVEELPPALMVARRDRVLALLGAVDQSRPQGWYAEMQAAELVELVRPQWLAADVYVPRVMELGRRRGHVRVLGPQFSAHGMVWQAEARRSRGALGDPCLAVTVDCLEGCQTSAYSVSVHLLASGQTDCRRFLQESHSHDWRAQSRYEFSVCSLSELQAAGVLDDDGGVVVRFSVRPDSFKDLAHVQQDRIRSLEQRVQELEQQQQELKQQLQDQRPGTAMSMGPERTLRRRGSSFTQDRLSELPAQLGSDPLPTIRGTPPAMQPSPLALRRRANSSLSLGEQQPLPSPPQPVPFPLNTSVFENLGATGSQSSVTSSQSSASNVLRRLSGWMKSTEGRVVHRARRVRQQLITRADVDDLDDWTLLDHSLSPGFPRAETEPISLHMQLARADIEIRRPPPTRPLPSLPDMLERGRDSEDGFAFDGRADIEREQAKIDARMAACKREGPEEGGLQRRYDSIIQRIDALQLIANTVENSRDGFTEGTLRRISSELGVLIEQRRSRISDAHLPSPHVSGRRTFSMGPVEMRRALSRANVEAPLGVRVSSIMSDNSDDISERMPSSRGTSGEYERGTSPPLPSRRNSLGLGTGLTTPVKPAAEAQTQQQQQLTPQANRRGGILKPGRVQRSVPTRMLPEIPQPTTDEAFGLISVRTPRGPGRYTEYTVAGSQSSSPASTSPVESKSARSATLPPNASRVNGTRQVETTPTARDATAGLGRQVRSARASRKRVRFPEEQRLLETIRLIDPRVAESIECRAVKATDTGNTSADAAESPVRVRSPPPPAFKLNIRSHGEPAASDDDLSDEFPAGSGLAARIRSSPGLPAKRLSADAVISNRMLDEDDVFIDHSSSSPLSSPDQYDTANSQLFSECEDIQQRPVSTSTIEARRKPIPRQLQLTRATISGTQLDAGHRYSAAILDHTVLSPSFTNNCPLSTASSPRGDAHGESRRASRVDKLDALSAGLNISMQEPRRRRATINASGMAVGPNVGSPPSSPSTHALGSANCSSSPSPTLDASLAHGLADSAHTYIPNATSFDKAS
ncbi:hypothetical protein IWW52_003949 [Coemansia sp. RSA 2704]|nr:hypothetical protein IWW52_003949 [Coemansia sp. RSA 2704]